VRRSPDRRERLALQPADGRSGRRPRAVELERDVATERASVREVDRAHAAAAKRMAKCRRTAVVEPKQKGGFTLRSGGTSAFVVTLP